MLTKVGKIGLLVYLFTYLFIASAKNQASKHWFYRAMLCIARTMLSQDVCLSLHLWVRLSVTRRYSVKTANISNF